MKKKRVVIISLLLLLVSVIGISSYFLFKDKINLLDVDHSAVDWNGKNRRIQVEKKIQSPFQGLKK